MNQSFLIPIFSVLVLLLIAVLFLYLYLRNLRMETIEYWEQILKKLRVRIDMIPALVENVRKHTKDQEKLLDELIVLRARSWPQRFADGTKVNLELSLTKELHNVWSLTQKISGLATDTNFLALKKDFHDLGKEIDEMVEIYNEQVRSFNKKISWSLLDRLTAALRLKKLQIFEFES